MTICEDCKKHQNPNGMPCSPTWNFANHLDNCICCNMPFKKNSKEWILQNKPAFESYIKFAKEIYPEDFFTTKEMGILQDALYYYETETKEGKKLDDNFLHFLHLKLMEIGRYLK